MAVPYIGTHIVQVTDTHDDDAKVKIASAYVNHTSQSGIYAHISILPANNSIIIGTKVSELVTNTERPQRLIVAVNIAPPDRSEGTENNARKDFFCADLGDGISVCGTSNGSEFSYIKARIKSLYRLTNTNSIGSQFRSLQILPKYAVLFSLPEQRAKLIDDRILKRIENVDDIVPAITNFTHVIQVDNFLNVKLFASWKDLTLLNELAETKRKVRFAWGKDSLPVVLTRKEFRRGAIHSAIVCPSLFKPAIDTNVLCLASSSRLIDGQSVPMIATLRQNPAETLPRYPVPKVGMPVLLYDKSGPS